MQPEDLCDAYLQWVWQKKFRDKSVVRSSGFLFTFLLILLFLVPVHSYAQNTANTVTNGQSDLTAAGTYSAGSPTTTNDVVLSSVTYTPTAFTLNTNGYNLNIGTLNDLDTTQTITINNTNGSGTTTITLNGGSNSVSGTAGDLLYVKSGGTLSIGTASTGTLNLALGATGNFDINGSANIGSLISGSYGITMTGTGTLTLSNTSNSYTGATTISSGTLSINSNSEFSSSSGISLNGGTLQTTNTASITLTPVITIGTSGGTLSITGTGGAQGGRVVLNSTNNLVGSGALMISGNGTLDSSGGSGALVIDKSNTYSGTITLQNGGIIEYGSTNAVASGATFNLGNNSGIANNGFTVSNAITVNGTGAVLFFNNSSSGTYSGPITLNNTLSVQLQNWYNSSVQSGAISGVISGTGGLTVVAGSGGTLTLSGTSTYTGTTTVNANTTLKVTGLLENGIYSGNLVNNGTINFSTTNQILSGAFSGNGTYIDSGTLTLDFSQSGAPTSNILSSSSALTMGGGTLYIKGKSGATNAQTVNGFSTASYTSSALSVTQNGATAVNLTLGAITRGAQSTLDLTLPTSGTVTTTSTGFATNGILASAANGTVFATASGGTTWLANNSGTLAAFLVMPQAMQTILRPIMWT